MLMIWKALVVMVASTLGYFSHFIGPFKFKNYTPVDAIIQKTITQETGYKWETPPNQTIVLDKLDKDEEEE